MVRTRSASASTTTILRSLVAYPSGRGPPTQSPLRLEAAILSRMRSEVTSRSNWAKDKSTLRVKRPIEVVVLNCWVTETKERSSRQGRSLAGCKSPHRQLPVFGRLAYPMRGEATNRVLLGRKSPGCPAGVFAAVGTIWGASKLGGRNITKYLQPRKSPLARSRFKRDNCGKPTHFPVGKADDTVEETGASTRCTAGVGDPASKDRLLEITSGSCR